MAQTSSQKLSCSSSLPLAVDQSEEGSQRGTEYVFESDWGEQLKGVVCPVVGVVNVRTEECSVVDSSKMGDISGERLGRNH